MPQVSSRALRDRLTRVVPTGASIEDVARGVFDTVSRQVPFAFACLATTDPASGLITRALKSRPLQIGDEDFAAAEYGRPDINLFSEIERRPEPVGVLSVDTDGDLARCHRFRDFMAPVFGFTDELRLACLSRGTTWAVLALYRGPGEPRFTTAEAALLVDLHTTIAEVVQGALFAGGDRPSGQAGASAGVLIVDGADRVTDVTAAVWAHIDDLGGWDNGSLPSNVLAVVALARARSCPAGARVRTRSGRWLALQAMPLDSDGPRRSVVVTMDTAPASAVGEMTLQARGLTGRETEVTQLVLQGASTKDIAATLFLSPHTVQDHLKAVFGKLGVTSRREMIARLIS